MTKLTQKIIDGAKKKLPTEIPAFYYNENTTLDGVTLFRGKKSGIGFITALPDDGGPARIPRGWGEIFARDALGRVWVIRRNHLPVNHVASIDIPPLAAALGVTQAELRRHIKTAVVDWQKRQDIEHFESLQRQANRIGYRLSKLPKHAAK